MQKELEGIYDIGKIGYIPIKFVVFRYFPVKL